MSIIERLKNSKPTLSPEDSKKLFLEILTGSQDWVCFSSAILGMDSVTQSAEQFVQHGSVVDIPGDQILTSSPIHIFAYDDITYRVIGLLYANGAIAYTTSEKPDEQPLFFLWVERALCNLMNIPYFFLNKDGVFPT